MGKLWFALVLSGCTTTIAEDDGPAAVFFPIDGSIETAIGQARLDPAAGVRTTFPVTAVGIADGTEVRLLAGRSSNAPGYPLTTGSDVIIENPYLLATSVIDDGHAEFPHLEVTTGPWSSGTDTLPAELLCGVTVIAARAYEGDGVAKQFLAATWLLAVSEPCDE